MDRIYFALILGAAIALFSLAVKLLSRSGSAATFALASLVFWLGGWQYTVPILAFFLLSSLLSQLGRTRKQRFAETFEKTSTRDAWQVLANGGVPAMALIANELIPGFPWYIVYLAAIASVTADTWATEVGVLSRSKPRFILNWNPVEHGTSGAISIPGTLGGLLGAAVIAATGALFAPLSADQIILIVVIGGLGNLTDSLLGASVQAIFECTVCGARTERANHHGKPTRLVSGFRFIGNDAVNFISALIAGVLAAALLAGMG
jgi:uncharacterized protein (TIGR00297 family)